MITIITSIRNFSILCISAFFVLLMFSQNMSIAQTKQQGASIPPEVGLWATKAEDGVFQVYPCGQDLCGRLVGMKYTTTSVPTSSKGTSQCHFLMLRNFVKKSDSNRWVGKIADPRNEKIYDAKIWLSKPNELRLRGYMGISLLGETHVWHRFNGKIGASCRLPM